MPVEEQQKVQLAVLYRTHGPRLRAALARLAGPGVSADDLLQEVFVIAFSKLQAFGEAGPPVPWLFGVANKVAVSARRRARLWRRVGLESAPEPMSSGTPHTLFEHAESAARVHAALERLDAKKRSVFVLYELEGLSGEEIAQALGVPLKTVWTRLGRARTEVSEALRREEARMREQEGLAHERA